MLLKLFISLIVFPLLLPNSNKVEVNKVKEASLGSSALLLAHAPYLLTLSLGDDLSLEGLIVKDNDTLIPHHLLSFSGHDPQNLGEQTITVTYEGKYTSFDIYVTNTLLFL